MSSRSALPAPSGGLIWTKTLFGRRALRCVMNSHGTVGIALFDFLAALNVAPEHWHAWTRIVRDDGFRAPIIVVEDFAEAFVSPAAIKHLLDRFMRPSPRRRTLYAQLRKAEREACRNG